MYTSTILYSVLPVDLMPCLPRPPRPRLVRDSFRARRCSREERREEAAATAPQAAPARRWLDLGGTVTPKGIPMGSPWDG